MPYDDMDKFVAFSKCLAGLNLDGVADDHPFNDLASKIVDQMDQLLAKMNQSVPQSAGDSAAEHVARHGGVVSARGVAVVSLSKDAKTAQRLPVLSEILDQLFKQIKIVQSHFSRGVTFAEIHLIHIETLLMLATTAKELATVLQSYQCDVHDANRIQDE